MKHLKTFESFNNQEMIDEGFFGDVFNKVKDTYKEFTSAPLNEKGKKLIEKGITALEKEGIIELMSLGGNGEQTKFTKEGFMKMAEEADNFNGTYKYSKNKKLVYYIPREWGSSSGAFKTTGGFGG